MTQLSQKIRWGILGAANIATAKVIPAMQRGDFTTVAAIASRDLAKAKTAAQKLGIAKAYGSYEELLADPDIDAIYNPTPNNLHIPWSIRALESGKHVLCEKPIGLSSEEARSLIAAGKRHPKLKLMEAFMYRHHPQWIKAKQLVTSGAIGQLRTIQSFFSYFNRDLANVRNHPGVGGGGLMDIGCYPISLSRFLVDREPNRVLGIAELDPDFQVDRLASAILDFGDVTSTFTCATQLSPYQRVHVHGTTGRIEIEIPFNAPPDRPCILWHQTAAGIEEITFPTCDQYTIQGDLFAQAILNDTIVPTPIEDALANMRVIEALFESDSAKEWKAL